MKKLLMASAAAIALAVIGGAGTVLAKPDPSNACYGQITAGIASTWPWAHDGKSSFPPAPGAIALWVQEFGPLVGVSSVRELQVLFCGQ